MKINFKNLDENSEGFKKFCEINDEAFPPWEHMSMQDILSFASKTNTDALGIYDGDMPIGFVVVMKNDRCGYVYFYAIDKCQRSKGYGGAALKQLLKRYDNIQMTLDFESPDVVSDNQAQRIRRRDFYLRNGFYKTGRFTLLEGERFEVVCSDTDLDEDGLKDLLETIHTHIPRFQNVLL